MQERKAMEKDGKGTGKPGKAAGSDLQFVKECKLKDTPDCPLVKKEKAKKTEATASVAVATTVSSCCKTK